MRFSYLILFAACSFDASNEVHDNDDSGGPADTDEPVDSAEPDDTSECLPDYLRDDDNDEPMQEFWRLFHKMLPLVPYYRQRPDDPTLGRVVDWKKKHRIDYKRQTMRFENKCVFITGRGSGIGRASALDFAKKGGIVGVADFHADNAGRMVEAIKNAGGPAYAFTLDTTDPNAVAACTANAAEEMDGLDILFNSAGVRGIVSVLDLPRARSGVGLST